MFKLLVVRFDRNSGTFDDAEFNKFCEEHSIIKIEKETLHVEGNIFYSFFIEYLVLKSKFESHQNVKYNVKPNNQIPKRVPSERDFR